MRPTSHGEPDRRARHSNFREGWRGHLWQGRFASFVLDESYPLTAARYVELNPVRADSVNAPRRHRWSSATARLPGPDEALISRTYVHRNRLDFFEAF